MEVIGTIKKISALQQITPTFAKRELVLLTDEMYPQTLLVEFAQNRASLLDAFREGQYVKIDINLRGREWNDPKTGTVRYFTTIGGWRIEPWQPGMQATPSQTAVQAQPASPVAQPAAQSEGFSATASSADEAEDDLPF